jgi:diguanylate cyclase (GGDEF)-like protein
MDQPADTAFDVAVWGPALESFGAVAQLTVSLYGGDGHMVGMPLSITPLFATFQEHGHDPGLFAECARDCLAQAFDQRSPVVVSRPSGLAVVGIPLVLNGSVVGAAVAGYVFVNFCESVAIERLARQCGIPFPSLWAVARKQKPVSTRRLVRHGGLLQVLGDTLLRENDLRRRSEQTAIQLAYSAHHDALTGLPNRVLLGERLARALALARRHQRLLAVLYLDIDRFKSINDALGHPIGDQVLQAVGCAVTQCIRDSDTVGRHGGDEFIVVLSELAQAEGAAAAARTIIAALGELHHVAGHDIRIGASIGISLFPADGDDPETLLRHADMALYRAKELGGDRFEFFQPEMTVRAIERRALEAGLHRALTNREFELFYQPKVDLTTGGVIGAEALIRWRHPERGLVPPAEFVPVAEACGLIGPIGRWVVREACRQARCWQDAGLRPVPVAVNISAVEFRSDGFLQGVIDTLADTGLAPRYLELELTESVLMKHAATTTSVLQALKSLGVQLAIDDFGTGWSSLSYLGQFPVDVLKIDQSFVQDITARAYAAPIVTAVIGLGKSLNLRVIAEGVETRDQLAFLQAQACVEGQGYYFSRPVVATQFARMLETGLTPS